MGSLNRVKAVVDLGKLSVFERDALTPYLSKRSRYLKDYNFLEISYSSNYSYKATYSSYDENYKNVTYLRDLPVNEVIDFIEFGMIKGEKTIKFKVDGSDIWSILNKYANLHMIDLKNPYFIINKQRITSLSNEDFEKYEKCEAEEIDFSELETHLKEIYKDFSDEDTCYVRDSNNIYKITEQDKIVLTKVEVSERFWQCSKEYDIGQVFIKEKKDLYYTPSILIRDFETSEIKVLVEDEITNKIVL